MAQRHCRAPSAGLPKILQQMPWHPALLHHWLQVWAPLGLSSRFLR